jgi:hypothetical protein
MARQKLAAAEHLLNTGHEIQFEKTHRLNRKSQIGKETIEIQLLYLPKTSTGRLAFLLSHTWQLVASLLKCCPQPGIDSLGQVQQHFDSSH